MTYSDVYLQSRGAVCSPSSDGGVIYSPGSGAYYAVNEVAMSIWGHIASPATAAQVTDALLQEYDVPAAALEGDVRATLEYLESIQLVQRTTGTV